MENYCKQRKVRQRFVLYENVRLIAKSAQNTITEIDFLLARVDVPIQKKYSHSRVYFFKDLASGLACENYEINMRTS